MSEVQTSTPEIIDFSVGMSDPASFPTEELADAAARAIRKVGFRFAYYPGPFGHPGLRRVMARRETEREDFPYDPEEMALTNGSMQAVTLVGQTLMDRPGQPIVCEELTYSGTIKAYRGIGAELVGVPLDDEGMRMDALESTLDRLASEDRPPAFVYTIPTYQNPTAAVMSIERRRQMLEICRKRDVLIVDDNCYGDVRFDEPAPPSLYTLARGEGVVYLGSLSKIFAAGLRLGYLVAKQPLLDSILERRFDAGNSTLAASICAAYLEDRLWEHIEAQNAALRIKRDTLVNALRRELGDSCEWLDPVGGLFLWLRLPEEVDLDALEARGGELGVGFARGANFHCAGEDLQAVRLAFGHATPEQIDEGIARLGRCIREQLT